MKPRLLTALAVAAFSLGCPGGEGGVGGVLVVANVEVTPNIVDVVLGQTQQLSATPKTSSGIVVTGRAVTWSTTDGTVATVSASGVVTAMAVGGPVRIRATVDGVAGDAVITVRQVPVDHVTVEPPDASILVNGQQQLVAKARDPAGVELPGRSFAWSSSASGIAAVTSTGLVLGVAEGGPVTITATSEGKSGTASISVSTRPATRVGILQQPGLTTAGLPMTPAIRVALQDDFLTTVLGAANPVTIALAGNPGGATLTGTTTRPAVNGVATFNDLSLNRVGVSYTFLVTSPGLVSTTSNPFDVIAGSANQLAFATSPSSSAQSGVPLAQQPVLQLRDGSGNSVAQAGLVITASIESGPAGATLGGTLAVTTNAGGSASFGNLSISGTAGSYTLSFSAGGVSTLTSGSITLGAGSPTQLAIVTQPSSGAQSGVPLGVQPALQLRDAVGNNVAQGGVVVTASIASGGGLLGGATTAVTNPSGLASFSSLAINGPAGQYTLSFTAPSMSGAVSGSITLGAGAPTQLAITTQPSPNATNGAVFSRQPVVQLRDASNNPVAISGVLITATVGSGTLAGTVTRSTDVNGNAAFTDLALSGPAGTYAITFSASGLTSVTSGSILLAAGTASKLTLTTQPSSSAQSGVAFSQQPVLQLRDASNNAVSQSGLVVSATIASGGGALGGTATATTNASGIATFTNLSISGTVGPRTLSFNASGVSGATSNTITLTAGAASQLSITTQPSSSAQSGVSFPQQPVIQLQDASSNPVSQAGIVIAASIASGGGTLGGTLTATTNASGAATFTNLSISGTVGIRTLSFAASGLGSVTSGNVTLAAGPASQISITTQPSSTAQSGVALSPQPVLQLRDAAGNAVSQSGVIVSATIASGGGTLGGTTTAFTDGFGIATFTNLSITGTTGDRTLSFTAGALTPVTSGTITVTAGAASQLAITTQPSSSAQSGVAFGQQPVIQLRDASNNPVATAGVVVTAAISTGGGTLGGTATATTNTSGTATFTNLSITGATGDRTLLFSASGFISVTSATITITAGGATQLSITTQPSSSAQSGVAFTQQPVLQLRDASSNPVSQSGVVVTAAIASGGGTLGGTTTATTNASGIATFTNLSISGTSGPRTLSFSASGVTGVTSGTITLTAGPASQLTITTQPSSSAQSGVAFAQQPLIQLRDASNNVVSQSGTVVTAAIASGGGTLGGIVTATTNASGVATFTNLSISGTVGARTLSFSASGLTGVSSGTITLTAGPASQLTIATQPSSSAQSGVAFTQQPVLQLRDASGNAVSQSGTVVTAAIASGGGTLGGTTTATTNATGVATFTNLSITGTAGDRTLSFSASGLTGVTSGVITVTAGAASKLAITTQPSSSAQSGVTFVQQPVIQLQDATGNNVSTSGVVVTAAISSGGGTLGGTVTATTSSGVATFTNLSITGTIGDRTLVFTASGFTSVTSGTITISAGAASQLSITTQPSSSAQSGVAFAQQPVIQLRDASSNAVSQTGVVVTATIASGGGTLGGTLTATTNASGVATFTDLKITGTVGARTLTFSATGLTAATSNTVTVTAGVADHLSITTQPSSTAQSGVALAQQPVLQLRDASNNAVSQTGVAITASIASGPGGSSLGGSTVVTTDASGAATYTNLSIIGAAGSYTIGFASSGLTGATSGSITLSAGTATKLGITTQPSSSVQSGAVFPQQPVIQLQDVAGNPVSQSGTVITATITSGGGTLGGTTTATTNASGVASFTNLSITGTAGARTLLFAAAGLTAIASSTITVTAGSATQLSITTQPSSSAQSGVAFGQQPAIQLLDASNNAVSQSGVVITAAIASGGGSLGGTVTATTNASGLATFSNLSISGTVGTRTLSFSATGLTGVTSGSINLTAGPAAKLAITTQPSSSAQSGVAFAQQPVIQIQDAAGNPVSQSGTVVTASIASGGGALGGTITATTNATGVASFTNLSITGTVGDRTLGVAASGLTGATSATITITAGAAAKLGITIQPSSSALSGAAFAQQPVIQVQDAGGNPVSQSGTVVTAAIATGGGTLGGTATATTNASGVATFTNLSISGTAGDRTLSFSATGLATATSNTITITSGSATQLGITTQPSSSAQSGVVFPQQPVIQLRDGSNNAVGQSGVVVTAAIASGGGTLGGTVTATTNASGVATFTNLSISGTVGPRTLSFSATGLTGATSGSITLTAGPASQLSVTTQPSSSAQNGVAFAQQPVIQLRDASSNAVSQSGTVITAAIASGGGSLGGTITATTNANGVASFTNLSITGTVGDRILSFSASGLTVATSGTIAITTGAASKLGITTQPSSSAQSGVAFAQQPVLQVQDVSGNPVSQNGTVVTSVIASGGGTLGGTATATTNASGTASFTNLSITGAAGDRTLTFSATGLTSATSGTITIVASGASKLGVSTQPSSSAQSGVAFAQQPAIQVQDASGNPVSQSGTVVTAVIASGGGTLGGTLTATTDASGVATFTNLAITGTIGNRTLSFTAGGLSAATSNTITITAGAAAKLGITTQPSSSAQSGAIFAQQPAVQIQDASGNPVSQSGTVVTAAIATGGATLGGTLTATSNASGVATFTNLSISGTIGDRTLNFSATGLTAATSGTITITAGAAAKLGITTQPSSSAQSGVAFAQQPVIQVQDAAGNSVSQSGTVVTAAIASGGGTLGGTLTATTNASGVATFTNLSITGASGDRTLSFSATGLTAAISSTITIGSAGASKLGITTQPSSSAQSGVAFAQQPVIQVQDGAGNPVSQSGTVVTAAIASGGGTLGGTVTATTNASGVATFTDLSITGTVGDRTLSFSATGLTGATSSTITITAGAAAKLGITTQPSSSAQSGVAFAQQPVIQVQDASGNPVSQNGTVVTAAIATGGGTLGGTLTATTNASGVASFTNLSITGASGDRSLSFSATGLTAATSNTVTIGAGGAVKLGITTQPSSSAQSGVGFAQQPVIQVQDGAGNPVSQSGTVVTAAIASGGGTLGGTLTATTNASGVATFTNLSITGTIGDRTLSFSATGLTGATSNTTTITAGVATKLGITTQPVGGTSGAALATQPVIAIQDAQGNTVTTDNATQVIVAIFSGAGGTLGGTQTVTAVNGTATFTNVTLAGTVGVNYVLQITANPALTAANSNNVTVTAGAPSQLTYNTQPSSSAQSGVPFLQQPVLLLQDASNNPIGSTTVTATITGSPAGVTFVGTPTATTNGSGVATFSGLGLNGPIGTYTLTFTAGAATSAASNDITLSAGLASILSANSVTTQTATISTAVADPPSVKVTDSGTNPIAGVQVTFAATAGSGTVLPATAAATNSSGIAAATSWVVGTGTGTNNNTATATATGLSGSPVSFNASGTTATQLSINTQPSSTAMSGTDFTTQPAVRLKDPTNTNVTQSGIVIAVSLASGTGTLSGPPTATTSGGGVATFSGLKITGSGSYTLRFSSGNLNPVVSTTITVSP